MNHNIISNQALKDMAQLFSIAGEYRQLHLSRCQEQRKLKNEQRSLKSRETDKSILGGFEDCGNFYKEQVESTKSAIITINQSILSKKQHMQKKLKLLRDLQRQFDANFPAIAHDVGKQIDDITNIDKLNHLQKKRNQLASELVLCLHAHFKDNWRDLKRQSDREKGMTRKIENTITDASLNGTSKHFNKNVQHEVGSNPHIIRAALDLLEIEKEHINETRLEQLNNIKKHLESNNIFENS